MTLQARLIQIATIAIAEIAALAILAAWLPGLHIESFWSAAAVAAVLLLAQSFSWWVFISFFAWLPVWLYPVATFVLSGAVAMAAGNLVRGITIDGIGTGIWISLTLTAVNAVLGALLSLDSDERFDRNVTRRMVARQGQVNRSEVPGFLFLEIDGLSETLLHKAIDHHKMPTLQSWLDRGSHIVTPWQTDFAAQTGAMQPGILHGNNEGIPAYRWWDRSQQRIVASGDPRNLVILEKQLSSGRGLLAQGGVSRGNMYSGDADESMLTFSTMLDNAHGRGPGFYAFLASPFVVARLVSRFVIEVVKEWWQAWRQRRRKERLRVDARDFKYAFFRGFIGPFLQDLTTYMVIGDMLRGVPAVYALYAGYDDVAHFAGMQTDDAFDVLAETDRYFARIETALVYAPRPYHLVILSDHGQSEGLTFENAHGQSLEETVASLANTSGSVFASIESNEMWDRVNAFLGESIHADTRAAHVLRRAVRSKTAADGLVEIGPGYAEAEAIQNKVATSEIIVLASGCTGLIYFRDASSRLTYEEIQARYPDLVLGLVAHPGIGWVLVRSGEDGDMVLGKNGICFLDKDKVEGISPLDVYGLNAVDLLRRETSFEHCPDLLVNTAYDPATGELGGFENQASHHGGLGGPQNHAFILHPVELPANGQPIIGAENVYRLLREWRDAASGAPRSGPAQPDEA